MNELSTVLRQQETLDAELGAYLVDSPLGPVIKHPPGLLHPTLPPAQRHGQRAVARQARGLPTGHRRSATVAVPLPARRPYRVHAFTLIASQLNHRTYWTSLAELWVDAETIHEDEHLWAELLQDDSRQGRRHLMMTAAERRHPAKQPASLQVYRGFSYDDRQAGMSWSLDPTIARRFARRFGGHGQPRVATGTVEKTSVIAYFNGRGEHEIVVAPADVTHQQVSET